MCRFAYVYLLLAGGSYAAAQSPHVALEIKDYATMPITGMLDGRGQVNGLLSRVNFLREEPGGGRGRLFVNDLNGPFYILDKHSRKLTTYLDFNGREGHQGIFHRLTYETGYANGFINFLFDPDYAHNGRFYTIHLEDPALPGSSIPDNTSFPGFRTAGYSVTSAIQTPGEIQREAVLIEWTDTNISNSTFEGTARELMRVQFNGRTHPMGDFIFNPAARPGDADWRVLYIACGDGGSGETRSAMRMNPQRLDTLVGKILRIVPSLDDHKDTSSVSENGRYRIPDDNPFTGLAGARKEIWAYGLRNPSRLSWDDRLIANVIGLHTWETVVFIRRGANYGYSLREGNQALESDNKTAGLPENDKIPVRISDAVTHGVVAPTYPVIQYGHVKGGGDAVSSGYVYRGKAIPALRGKYLFGDISTGNLWYADYKEMLAADDADPQTMAPIHELKILWHKPEGGAELYGSMAAITESVYHARGGTSKGLPGSALVSGGRSDIHLCADADGKLYILSKSDGMIRAVIGAAAK
jgi:Glucose / Sorbosone dehydrogenase